MKTLNLKILLVIILSIGNIGVGWTKEKTPLNCSEEDRKTAKFWDNAYNPEDAFNFGKKIKQIIRERNLEKLFTLVHGELKSGPRKQFIKGKDFSDIFSDKWRNNLLASKLPCSPVGWRGFMLARGSIWFHRKHGNWYIRSILGARSENLELSKLPIGWKTPEGLIPPQCFAREWMSSDNFEEFAKKHSIKNYADFFSNPGKYLGRPISTHSLLTPSWGEKKLFLAAPYDLCFKGFLYGGEVGSQAKLNLKIEKNTIKTKKCSSKFSCTQYAYTILANIPLKKCHDLAPHINGKCKKAFLIAVGDYSGGSMGWDMSFNIYGLFVLKGKGKFIVPLKNFSKKNDAINYIKKSIK